MTFGDKLSKLRKENNYTQEQLAELLDVSRQSISKWESDLAYPETDKLIRLSELFHCSVDYLLKDDMETDGKSPSDGGNEAFGILFRRSFRERKSEKTLWGMPLWHVGRNARGVVAVGLNARGIIAIGLKARGVISFGLLSLGLLSFGMLSVGLFAFGMFALGILSAGCFAAGILAAGAICFGVLSLGAIAVGEFSVGALAVGKYFALGDHAQAMIAIGDTKAAGTLFEKLGDLTAAEAEAVKRLLDANVPAWLGWAKEIIKAFL